MLVERCLPHLQPMMHLKMKHVAGSVSGKFGRTPDPMLSLFCHVPRRRFGAAGTSHIDLDILIQRLIKVYVLWSTFTNDSSN